MESIVVCKNNTYPVEGMFSNQMEEGKLYIDPKSKRIYCYTTMTQVVGDASHHFPIYDGKHFFDSVRSYKKYESDVISTDVTDMASSISEKDREDMEYRSKAVLYGDILEPEISDSDNIYSQCIKGILLHKKYNLLDLSIMSNPKLTVEEISNLYQSLHKIAFMREKKFMIWMNQILHMDYKVNCYDSNSDQLLLTYHSIDKRYEFYHKNNDGHREEYDEILKKSWDPFKKMINLIIKMKNYKKADFNVNTESAYTINNMMTTIFGDKSVSAQIFSRFMRIINLPFDIVIYDKDDIVFTYTSKGDDIENG